MKNSQFMYLQKRSNGVFYFRRRIGPWWTCQCSEPPFGRSSCPRPLAVLPLSRLRSSLDQSQDGHPGGMAWPSENFPNMRQSCACVHMFNSEHYGAQQCARLEKSLELAKIFWLSGRLAGKTVWIFTASCIARGASIGNNPRLTGRSTVLPRQILTTTRSTVEPCKTNGEGGIRTFPANRVKLAFFKALCSPYAVIHAES